MSRPRQRRLLGGYAEEVAAAMRRRRDVRRPRVRVRVDHGEARVLGEDAPGADRLLALAREMLDEREEAPGA
ncbi:MAG: hypothetical protein ACRDLQ_10205 [Solirubrobacterales bacterium]